MPTVRTSSMLVAAALLSACQPYGKSRVANGQLYAAGNPQYDEYFKAVHQQQVDASSWGDDRKSAHRALVASLDLTPDAPDVTLVQATHEAASKTAKQAGSLRLDVDGTSAHVVASGVTGDGLLFRAIEETSHAELERARRLHGVEPRIDALAKDGRELSGHAQADFKTRGVGKQTEVTSELSSSIDVLATLKRRAEREARESEDFVADLERALETASEERATKQREREKKKTTGDKDKDKPEQKKKDRDKDCYYEEPSKPPAPKPAVASEPAPPPKPAPPPPPKPADTGEVFTP